MEREDTCSKSDNTPSRTSVNNNKNGISSYILPDIGAVKLEPSIRAPDTSPSSPVLVPCASIPADLMCSIKLEPGLDQILVDPGSDPILITKQEMMDTVSGEEGGRLIQREEVGHTLHLNVDEEISNEEAEEEYEEEEDEDYDDDEEENDYEGDVTHENRIEGVSHYDSSAPKVFKYGHGLSCDDLIRFHLDPYYRHLDLTRQPLLVLDKVDKYWPPVPSSELKTEIKDEPLDIIDDPEWERAAEEEILAANEGFNDVCIEGEVEKVKKIRPKRISKPSKDFDNNPDEPDEMSESEQFDDENNENMEMEEEDTDDPTFNPFSTSLDDSNDPDLQDDDSLHSLDMFGSDTDSVDLSLVKQEVGDLEEGISRANGILASSQELKVVEIGGYKVETYGDYSKCPKCEKNIKSTFIIRHIKLHDLPSHVMNCPYESCNTSFTRSNNMYRHLKVVHDDDNPYICVYKNCNERFESSKLLREHVNKAHRKGTRREMEQMEASNMRYQCEFPGCEREYGKKQHLKEHFRKHTGDMRYACDVCGERFFVHGHMKRHLYSHTGIKPHACRWKCGAIFASYGGRMKHERAQHSENPYKLDCDICGRPFRFDRELDKHKLTHLAPNERMAYRCSYCGIIFDSISHRERHEQRHKDNDSFQCEDCNKMFKNEKNLRHHYKTHHELPHPKKAGSSQEIREKEPEKKDKKEPPKYPCHMCDIPVMFALTALRRHLARKHSTNYKCPKEGCGKTFAKQYQFDAHMKLHMHRSCHMCGKQFKRKQNADIHLMGVHGLTKEDLSTLGR